MNYSTPKQARILEEKSTVDTLCQKVLNESQMKNNSSELTISQFNDGNKSNEKQKPQSFDDDEKSKNLEIVDEIVSKILNKSSE